MNAPRDPIFACALRAWRQHSAELRRYLKGRAQDAALADDLLQDVFLRAMQQGESFCRLNNARAWLFLVARNLLIDRLRSMKEQVPLLDELSAETPSEATPVDALTQCLPRVLSELAPADREAIVLCDIGGLTQQAYADRLGITLSGAKARVQRARRRLRKRLSAACQVRFDEAGQVCGFVPRSPA